MLSNEELERYERFIRIDRVGKEGQEKIKKSSVLVVGAGGIGSPVLFYLGAVGVGKIGIVDGDKVNLSNLGRQILYSTNEIGLDKVACAKDKLLRLNPNLEVEDYRNWITDFDSAALIFKEYDAVIDATDNFETRYLINKVCVSLGKTLFIGAVGRFVGQVMCVLPRKTACLNCIFPEKEKSVVELITKRTLEQGVSAPLVGTVGCLVANEFVKFVLGTGQSLFNKLLLYDSLHNEFSQIDLQKDPKCKICS